MPIAEFKPEVNFQPEPVLPVAQPDNYMGLTYDNEQTPVVSLIAYVEGAPWRLEAYYRQVLGEHNDLKELDSNLSPEYQSYGRIDDMEIRVLQELDSTTDQEKQTTRTQGSAAVYAFIVPNVNDYFVAETSYRRKALFRVTNVNRVTWRRESLHNIEYVLVDYVEFLQQDMESLRLKTTSTYVFSRDRLMEGLTPYLKTEDYHIVNTLKDERKLIGDYYLNAFAHHASKTLMLPGQPLKNIYDNFLVSFVLASFDYLEFPALYKVTQLPKDGDQYLDQPQFWKAFLNRDMNLLNYGNKKMMVASTSCFLRNSYVKTLFSSRCDMIVYPYKPDLSTMYGQDMPPNPVFKACLKPTVNAEGEILTEAEKEFTILDVKIPAYRRVGEDEYYVLSKAFYTNDRPSMSLLELMVHDYMQSKTIDLHQLTFLVRLFPKMERMEQFYYGPILMCLMRYANYRTY